MAGRSNSECERVVTDVLTMMSLPEKAGQIAAGRWPGDEDTDALHDLQDDVAAGRIGMVEGIQSLQHADALQAHAYQHSRLGIPLLFPAQAGSGADTILPCPLSTAACWDPDTVAKAWSVVGQELADTGCNWVYLPPLHIHAGSDSFLVAVTAAAQIAGLQSLAHHKAADVLATLDLSALHDPLAMLRIARIAMRQGVGAIDLGQRPAADKAQIDRAFAFMQGPGGFDGILPERLRELEPARAEGPMPHRAGMPTADDLVDAVKQGRLSEAVLDDATARILRAKFNLGLLEAAHRRSSRAHHSNLPTPVHNRELALALACRSAILLRNDPPLLPLGIQSGDVLIAGRAAADRHDVLGGRTGLAASVIDGFEQLGIPHRYVQGLALREEGAGITRLLDADRMAIGMACEAAKRAGTTIYVQDGGEAGTLPEAEAALLSALMAVTPNLVMVTLGGVPINPLVDGKHVPALLHAGRLGTMSGHAVAHVLSGESAPSGKLPLALPGPATTGLPFGHGLTYSRHSLRDLTVEFDTGALHLFAQLRNPGERTGDAVVQVYMSDRDGSSGSQAEQRRLVAFQRVTCAPGETTTVSITLGHEEFGRYHADGSYRVMPGSYDVMLGLDARSGLHAAVEIDPALARAMGAQAMTGTPLGSQRRA